MGADFGAERHAGLVKLIPRTPRAAEWLARNTLPESSWYEGGLIVEIRYFPALADGIIEAGFIFERDILS